MADTVTTGDRGLEVVCLTMVLVGPATTCLVGSYLITGKADFVADKVDGFFSDAQPFQIDVCQ